MGRRLFSPKGEKPKENMPKHLPEDEMLTDNFDSASKLSLGINYNVASVLPMEYEQITEVKETAQMRQRWLNTFQFSTKS